MAENESKPSDVNFELNMSFDMLRESQWSRVLDALWDYGQISGPFSSTGAIDDSEPHRVEIQYPAPTVTYTQLGLLALGEKVIDINVLVTRSLFECISVTASSRIISGSGASDDSTFLKIDVSGPQLLEETFQQLALYLYQAVPFEIATIGWNRDCQLLTELTSDENARQHLFEKGGFLAQGSVLRKLGADEADFEEVVPGLWWMESQQR